jgi:hypothetical protein
LAAAAPVVKCLPPPRGCGRPPAALGAPSETFGTRIARDRVPNVSLRDSFTKQVGITAAWS